MTIERVPGYCALCISHCGCISTVEDGVLTKVEPDPSHPTGKNFCIKGKAAPELVNSPGRVLTPLRRTRPKGEDPGWRAISWDEALDFTASRMTETAGRFGPEAVAFSVTTPSGTAIGDAMPWIYRLINEFGSPNTVSTAHVCNWHKDFATAFTFGAASGMPDLERTGCLLLWGFNPSTCWLAFATAVLDAKKRGMKLVVIDPRRAGLASKADQWLRVRPGTDGALALGIAGVMIANGWYDRDFVSNWTNGPFLVREDDGRFLTASDLGEGGSADRYVVWDETAGRPAMSDPARRPPEPSAVRAALFGQYDVETRQGRTTCRPAFALYARLCAGYSPERTEELTGVPAGQIRAVAEMLQTCRPAAYYAWSGVGQNTNATQTSRAMCLLYALTGDIDGPGGNVYFAKPKLNDVTGRDGISPAQRAKTLGLAERPIGPAKDGWITTRELYRAILDEGPYPVKGLVAFGSNLLLSRPSPEQGVRALRKLDFYVHCDLFLTPMAAEADIVLPVSSAWEREGIAAGFQVGQKAEAHLQLRKAAIPPRGESRSDTWIAFELAKRLGLADMFFGGDMDAGLRYMLEPSQVTLEALRSRPEGIPLLLATEYRKYASSGFPTPTRRAEIYSQTLRDIGQPPLPDYVPPAASIEGHPEWMGEFPLRLTSAKWVQFCHSQFRDLPSLRTHMPDPLVELHPETAKGRGIAERDWVVIRSPEGAVHARAKFNAALEPDVVCVQYGWTNEPNVPAGESAGAVPVSLNFSELISNAFHDPVSGSFPLRTYACDVRRAPSP